MFLGYLSSFDHLGHCSHLLGGQRYDIRLQFPRALLFWLGSYLALASSTADMEGQQHTFDVFLDVELAQQHDGLFSEDAAVDRIRLVDTRTVAVQHDSAGICGAVRTYSLWMFRTPPVPPNLSFQQPKYTARMPNCLRAEAHITHGSTVT